MLRFLRWHDCALLSCTLISAKMQLIISDLGWQIYGTALSAKKHAVNTYTHVQLTSHSTQGYLIKMIFSRVPNKNAVIDHKACALIWSVALSKSQLAHPDLDRNEAPSLSIPHFSLCTHLLPCVYKIWPSVMPDYCVHKSQTGKWNHALTHGKLVPSGYHIYQKIKPLGALTCSK